MSIDRIDHRMSHLKPSKAERLDRIRVQQLIENQD
jgi:hypothetical protein